MNRGTGDLRVEQLRRFVVLAEELSFTRAAARLYLTQQTLSAQLQQLEASVGVELLARTTRRVELTPAGEAFLGRARLVIEAAEGAVRAAREAAGRLQLLLACEIDAQWLLADRLTAFRAEQPLVEVVVVYVLDLSALTDLAPSRIDAVAVWGVPPPALGDAAAPLALEEVYAVLRDDDPLARSEVAATGALADRTLWMWPPETGMQAWASLVGHVGIPAEAVAVVNGSGGPAQELMIAAVQDKGGYTFAPASYLKRSTPARTVALPLDPPLRIPLVLCWRGTPSAALRQLLQHLTATSADRGRP